MLDLFRTTVRHTILTLSPVRTQSFLIDVRLACVRHTALRRSPRARIKLHFNDLNFLSSLKISYYFRFYFLLEAFHTEKKKNRRTRYYVLHTIENKRTCYKLYTSNRDFLQEKQFSQ